jgi:hypothetical protein
MRLVFVAAMPMMHRLASEIDDAYYFANYGQGRQSVIAEQDAHGGLGASIRIKFERTCSYLLQAAFFGGF